MAMAGFSDDKIHPAEEKANPAAFPAGAFFFKKKQAKPAFPVENQRKMCYN